ncbi:C2 domain-containing protein/PRT_C domain-containing protein [Cephalotus follicularis]|uniref:C2 domain-containing protein/PRT_C domain-containing protein n=1 Tax=Cephalotus follicularis TaxID=3775 RepID=A0A1Q3BUS5_CEPFO|nr:C2 domain-containing protein/PRT_C domain-containing protein [Cephalotus follicularis]
MNYLFVKILKARDVPVTCFVEVKIGNYKGTTRYIENQPSLEWHQVFAFNKDRIQDTSMEIIVRDGQNLQAHDNVIGCLNFSLATDVPNRAVTDNQFAPEWHRLQNKNGARLRGELMMSAWNGTQHDDAFGSAWHSDSAPVSGEGIANTRAKVYLSPKLWYLRIKIIEAQDLVLKHENREPEVFIKAILGDLVFKSKVSSNKSLNPKWGGEELVFVAAEPFNDPLIVSVEDKYGPNNEECLGKLLIPLQNVKQRNTPVEASKGWYSLERHVVEGEENREVRFASKLYMAISLDGGYHVIDEPIHNFSDIRPTFKALWPGVLGVLELGILNASGLMAMKMRDGHKTTDAYCVAKYGPKWAKTRTIIDSLAPDWNEQYTWEVYDLNTVLKIGVFDNVHLQGIDGAKDPMIGKVKIRLCTLYADTIYTHTYPLAVLQPNGLQKMGEVQLAVRFTRSVSFFKYLWHYTRPILPKMHYVFPLSADQVDTLRHQAAHVISLRLNRGEPPLRKEVVNCVLDIGVKNLWSTRRGRANLARVMEFFDVIIAGWKWLEGIYRWKDQWQTTYVILIFYFFLWRCELILPTLYLYCIYRGIANYFKRQGDPPHLDAKLSYADSAHPDELAEELDTFPSSATGEVLRVRYDRLRVIGGKLVGVLGDFATELERLQSLLSWRDPRATLCFLFFCFFAFFAVIFTPPKCLVATIGFYVFWNRHPDIRVDIPMMHENFLRRLPSRTDCML